MPSQAKTFFLIPAVNALLLCLIGCGEPTGNVSGKATYKESPITAGSISFHMKSKGIEQSAKLDASGMYSMAQPLPSGTYHVFYVPPTPEPQDPSKGPTKAIKSDVPAKFQDAQTSTISVEVKSGRNDIPVTFKD